METSQSAAVPLVTQKKKRDVHLGDRLFFWLLRFCSVGIIVLLGAITFELTKLSLPAISKFGFALFTGTEWNPVTDIYGAAPFIYGTLVSSWIALVISVPISVGVALFLTEVAPKKISTLFGFLVEMLAAIPSVVYGLWGIFVLAPWLRTTVQPLLGKYLGFTPLFSGPPFGVGMMAAGVILGIMITPTIAAISREVFTAIPRNQREAALALGATRWEMIRLAVLKNSVTGILGAVILGLGRALGETMAVTMVIGNRNEINLSLFAPAQTMASAIANQYAEASNDLHLAALTGVGVALFAISFLMNSCARLLVMRLNRKGASR